MQTGISVYLSTAVEENERILERAAAAGASLVFSSLQIPEEDGKGAAQVAKHLMSFAHRLGLHLIVDVSPETPQLLGCNSLSDLKDLGISHLRLDYGFDARETVELSKRFNIVLNASTINRNELKALRAAGADFSRFTACHNFYPKPYTGLRVTDVRDANRLLESYGFEIMGFVPGDKTLRGPLYEGLPTVEAHRPQRDNLAYNMLEMGIGAHCDVVIVGDVDLSDAAWQRFSQISAGYVEVKCSLGPAYAYLAGQIHHDRPDSSEWVFRSQESRANLRPEGPIGADATAGTPRKQGSIGVANEGYLRYAGELEIARTDLPGDVRINCAGALDEKDLKLLPYLRDGFGVRLCTERA